MTIANLKTYRMWAQTRNWLFVKVLTDEGIYGWGEASLEFLPDITDAAVTYRHEDGSWSGW